MGGIQIITEDCNQSQSSKKFWGASLSDSWDSTFQLRLAQLASYKTDFLCALGGILSFVALTGGCCKQGMALRFSSFKQGINDFVANGLAESQDSSCEKS